MATWYAYFDPTKPPQHEYDSKHLPGFFNVGGTVVNGEVRIKPGQLRFGVATHNQGAAGPSDVSGTFAHRASGIFRLWARNSTTNYHFYGVGYDAEPSGWAVKATGTSTVLMDKGSVVWTSPALPNLQVRTYRILVSSDGTTCTLYINGVYQTMKTTASPIANMQLGFSLEESRADQATAPSASGVTAFHASYGPPEPVTYYLPNECIVSTSGTRGDPSIRWEAVMTAPSVAPVTIQIDGSSQSHGKWPAGTRVDLTMYEMRQNYARTVNYGEYATPATGDMAWLEYHESGWTTHWQTTGRFHLPAATYYSDTAVHTADLSMTYTSVNATPTTNGATIFVYDFYQNTWDISTDGAVSYPYHYSAPAFPVDSPWGDVDVRTGTMVVTTSDDNDTYFFSVSKNKGATWEHRPNPLKIVYPMHSGQRWVGFHEDWDNSVDTAFWSDDLETWTASEVASQFNFWEYSSLWDPVWTGQRWLLFYSLWYAASGDSVHVALSDDNAETFDTIVTVPNSASPVNNNVQIENVVVRRGVVHMWFKRDASLFTWGAVYYTTSSDHGATWSNPQQLTLTGGDIWTDYDTSGGIYWFGGKWITFQWIGNMASSTDGVNWFSDVYLPGGMYGIGSTTLGADGCLYVWTQLSNQHYWNNPNFRDPRADTWVGARLLSDLVTWERLYTPPGVSTELSYSVASIPYPLLVRTLNNVTAGLRKPPSQRNPEHKKQFVTRALSSMAPGSMQGRVANASATAKSSVPVVSIIGTAAADIVFSHPGPPVQGPESGPYRISGSNATVAGVIVTLSVAGSSSTVVEVRKNGVAFATITIGSGATSVSEVVTEELDLDDIVTVAATAVGSGASGLTVQVVI